MTEQQWFRRGYVGQGKAEGHGQDFLEFFSFNGSKFYETANVPLRAGKGWLYEGGIRVPMIIKWPGVVKPGSVCGTPVVSTDFYPTILQIAGLPSRPQQHKDGLSLVPLLKGAKSLDRRAIYWHYPHCERKT